MTKTQLFDKRRLAIAAVVTVFTVVPVVHVAEFTGSFEPTGHQGLGYVYAIGLDFAIAICAWFTRWAITRRIAWLSYFVLVLVDGSFNVAYVEPWESDKPAAAWLYAVFPTLIVAILSLLARQVDALSARSGKVSAGDAIVSAIGHRLGLAEQPVIEPPAPAERSKVADIADWRAIYADLPAGGDPLSTDDVQRLLAERGFERVPPSTARRWKQEANRR
jgi:hypothetical protein